jgi:hypothetical protein
MKKQVSSKIISIHGGQEQAKNVQKWPEELFLPAKDFI